MIRSICLALIFLLSVAAALISSLPLGFALERGGLARTGVIWASVEGTIWRGQVSGLRYGIQPVGDVSLSFRPRTLLRGQLAYDMSVSGPAARGFGVVAVSRDRATLSEFVSEIRIAELAGLAEDVRRIGGVVRMNIDALEIADNACKSASGQVTTDALTNAARTYGRDVGDMTGSIECDGGMLVIPMAARSVEGDEVITSLRLGLVEPSAAQARVRTDDLDLGNALVLLGFDVDGPDYVFRREVQLGR